MYMTGMMAFASRPSRAAVQQLAPLVEHANAPRQAMLGISAMIKNLIRQEPSAVHDRAVQQVVDSLANIARQEKVSE